MGWFFRCLALAFGWIVGLILLGIIRMVLEENGVFRTAETATAVHVVLAILWTITYFVVLTIIASLHSSRAKRIRAEERIRADERRRIWEEEQHQYANHFSPNRPTDQNKPPVIPNTDNSNRPNPFKPS